MQGTFITQTQLISTTIQLVHDFYNHTPTSVADYLADDCMWIGPNAFQWAIGRDNFLRFSRSAYEEMPLLVSDEDFNLLYHERNVWIVYGHYNISAPQEYGQVMQALVRVTFVWRRIDGMLKLSHIHGSYAQEYPINTNEQPKAGFTPDDYSLYEHLRYITSSTNAEPKLAFCDRDGVHHMLFANELLYLQANGPCTVIHTTKSEFTVTGTLAAQLDGLPEQFTRIHKSYVVNLNFVSTLCRYTVTMKNGETFPVSKGRYMQVKDTLYSLVTFPPLPGT